MASLSQRRRTMDRWLYGLERSYGLPVDYVSIALGSFDPDLRTQTETETVTHYQRVSTFEAEVFHNLLAGQSTQWTSMVKSSDRFFIFRGTRTVNLDNNYIIFDGQRWNIKDYTTLDASAGIIFQTERSELTSYTLTTQQKLAGQVTVVEV